MKPGTSSDLKIDFVYAKVVNFALQQNHVPVIRKLSVINKSGRDYHNLNLILNFEPEFALPITAQLSDLYDGNEFAFSNFDLKLSPKFLYELTERVTGNISIKIFDQELLVSAEDYSIDILTFDQWQGLTIMPEMISAYITPNNPLIAPILGRASVILSQWTGSSSFDEYESRNPDRVKKQMAAVFEAIREMNINYCTPPATFEATGQRIRMIDTLLSQKLGTCLDMSLLYASCLEAIGIHPLFVVVKGHAFSGGWLIEDTFPDCVSDDSTLLSKRAADGINEVLLVESTCMNSGNGYSFDNAAKSAALNLTRPDDFIFFVDVKRTRYAGIRPLPQRVKTDNGWEFTDDTRNACAFSNPKEVIQDDKLNLNKETELSRQQLWERKLLDLSLRNNLLNTRMTRSTIPLISVQLDKLEDALAAGDEFSLLSSPLDWDNSLRQPGIYQALNLNDPLTDLVINELTQKRLRTYLNESELVSSLTNLYRASRLSLEENGANTLYLSLGLLKWYETPASQQPRYAPILLLPVEIIRKSAQKGYILRSREEEALMNITLLEMLRQDFKLLIPELDPLPRDQSGVDVKRIFNIIRQAVMLQNRWDVDEQAILGTFSFNKFILWNDIHNNARHLKENKIVSSLITGLAQWDVDTNQFSSEELEKQYHPAHIALPIQADSSQLEAICAAHQNKSFILHGPPGTGKSQTITNIIANALFNGKKVLFVAEKMAALSVVQKRLESIGLAPFCIELHSNKTKKSSLLDQLRQSTEIVSRASTGEFLAEAERVNRLRAELNDYVEALHRKYPFGFSLFDAFSAYASIPGMNSYLPMGKAEIKALSKEKISHQTGIVEEMQSAAALSDHVSDHPLKEIQALNYAPQNKAKAGLLIDQYRESLTLVNKSQSKITAFLNLKLPVIGRDQLMYLKEISEILLTAIDIPASVLAADNPDESLKLIIRLSENGLTRNEHRDYLLHRFLKEILKIDAEQLKDKWVEAGSKWLLPRIIEKQSIIKRIKSFAVGKQFDASQIEKVFDTIINFQNEQNKIDSHQNYLLPILGIRWQEGNGDWNEIRSICQHALKISELLLLYFGNIKKSTESRLDLSETLKTGLKAFLTIHGDALKEFILSFRQLMQDEQNLNELLKIDFNGLEDAKVDFVTSMLKYCVSWQSGLDSLREWVVWNQTKSKAKAEGLNNLVVEIESGKILNEHFVTFFLKNLYRNLADYIIEEEGVLSTFNGKMFEEKIKRFRELDKRYEKLTISELYYKLASVIPSFTKEAAQSSEIGILMRNLRSCGRGMSIRKLFDTIPGLLTRLAPCMLMSPISVAQYIDLRNFKFDLIIFDEASQMPTCEAVGAIARGKNLIVVGDPKQMPPTSFFTSNNIDEENLAIEDLESILDDCLALTLPSKHLLWHYRSRHESLITFSNSQYYDNTLLTFPSPDDQTTKVHFVPVKGYYDRSKSRQNRSEAKAIIDEIIRRLSDPSLSARSIGVVTFSSVQQILIDDLLNDVFKLRPDLEKIATESSEPIFIKNLENVQGDERDVILFSIGYGPDKDNKVNLNFGPLNREGGWRRLNVAVSRARYEMMVFSTLTADQIDVTRSSSLGVAGLKAFLEFAQRGKNHDNRSFGNKTRKLTFVDHLATQLKAEGFEVATNIGSSIFKIDLGIINPERPAEYLLGVLCDGETYKSSKTVKDREIIQIEVLQQLGWKIHKIWSCDWWDNPQKVLEGIKQAIINGANSNPTAEVENPDNPGINIDSETRYPNASDPAPTLSASEFRLNYEPAVLSVRTKLTRPDQFFHHNQREKICSDISKIMHLEAPVSKDLMGKKILAAWSLSRMTPLISSYLDSLFVQLNIKQTGTGKRFLWNEQQDPDNYLHYRVPVNGTDRRDALDISPEEVSNVVREILEHSISLNRDDLLKESARILGFNRIGGNVDLAISAGIDKAVSRGFAKVVRERVHFSN